MCLYYNPTTTGNVRRRLNRDGKIICYKHLDLYEGEFYSPYYNKQGQKKWISGVTHGQKWTFGWTKSNRANVNKNENDDNKNSVWQINKGIHLYLKQYTGHLLRVTCYAKDFVGAGGCGECVFKRVFVTKKDWKNYLKSRGQSN